MKKIADGKEIISIDRAVNGFKKGRGIIVGKIKEGLFKDKIYKVFEYGDYCFVKINGKGRYSNNPDLKYLLKNCIDMDLYYFNDINEYVRWLKEEL